MECGSSQIAVNAPPPTCMHARTDTCTCFALGLKVLFWHQKHIKYVLSQCNIPKLKWSWFGLVSLLVFISVYGWCVSAKNPFHTKYLFGVFISEQKKSFKCFFFLDNHNVKEVKDCFIISTYSCLKWQQLVVGMNAANNVIGLFNIKIYEW